MLYAILGLCIAGVLLLIAEWTWKQYNHRRNRREMRIAWRSRAPRH